MGELSNILNNDVGQLPDDHLCCVSLKFQMIRSFKNYLLGLERLPCIL